jgi:sec-independent protein translocase protein TatA
MFYSKPYWDVLIVVLVLVLFFGPKRLPALGRSLGEGMREFKDSITGRSKDSDEAERSQLEAATSAPAAGVAQQPVQATTQAAPAPAQAVPPAQPASAPQVATPPTQPVPSAPQPPQQDNQAVQPVPQPPQPGTQPTQPVPSAPQPPPAAEPAQPATVSTPAEPSSDRGSDSRA